MNIKTRLARVEKTLPPADLKDSEVKSRRARIEMLLRFASNDELDIICEIRDALRQAIANDIKHIFKGPDGRPDVEAALTPEQRTILGAVMASIKAKTEAADSTLDALTPEQRAAIDAALADTHAKRYIVSERVPLS